MYTVKLSLAIPECDPDGVGLLGRLVRLGSCGLEQEQVGPQHHGTTSKTVQYMNDSMADIDILILY
jgi:hypothetical protein